MNTSEMRELKSDPIGILMPGGNSWELAYVGSGTNLEEGGEFRYNRRRDRCLK